MSEDQRLIPPSFLALYLEPGRSRPSLPLAEIRERLDFCEDLSVTLVEQAGALQHELGLADEDVLSRMLTALSSPESTISEAEARWTVGRLAEHLGWFEALAAIGIRAEGSQPVGQGRRGGVGC